MADEIPGELTPPAKPAVPASKAGTVKEHPTALDELVRQHVHLRDYLAASKIRTSDAALETEVGPELAEVRDIYAVIRKCLDDADTRIFILSQRVTAGEISSAEIIAGFKTMVDELYAQSATHRERLRALKENIDKQELRVDGLAVQTGGAVAVADLAASKITDMATVAAGKLADVATYTAAKLNERARDESAKGRAFDLGDTAVARLLPKQIFALLAGLMVLLFVAFVFWVMRIGNVLPGTAPSPPVPVEVKNTQPVPVSIDREGKPVVVTMQRETNPAAPVHVDQSATPGVKEQTK